MVVDSFHEPAKGISNFCDLPRGAYNSNSKAEMGSWSVGPGTPDGSPGHQPGDLVLIVAFSYGGFCGSEYYGRDVQD